MVLPVFEIEAVFLFPASDFSMRRNMARNCVAMVVIALWKEGRKEGMATSVTKGFAITYTHPATLLSVGST
jgi:hypothetical protein